MTKWFQAIYLLTQNKNAVSALALSRQIGVSYKSAWLLKHKLMQTMLLRDEQQPLQGRVEIDDAVNERATSTAGARRPTRQPSLQRCKPRTMGIPCTYA